MEKQLLLTTFFLLFLSLTSLAMAKQSFNALVTIKDVSCSSGTFTVTFNPILSSGEPDYTCSSSCGFNPKIKLNWPITLYQLDNNYQDTSNKIVAQRGPDTFCATGVGAGCINSPTDPTGQATPVTTTIPNVDCSKKYRVVVQLTEEDPTQPTNYCAGVDPCNDLPTTTNQPPSLVNSNNRPKPDIQPTFSPSVDKLYTTSNPTVSAAVIPDILRSLSCEVCFSTNPSVCQSKIDTSSAWVKGTLTGTSLCSATTSLPYGTIFYYGVRARDATGNTGIIYSDNPAIVDSTPPVITFDNLLNSQQTSSQVSLSWTAHDDLSGLASPPYQVQRSINGGQWAIISKQSQLSFTDSMSTNNQINCYKVIATDNVGNSADTGITCTRYVSACQKANPTLIIIGDGQVTQSSNVYYIQFPLTIKNSNNIACPSTTFSITIGNLPTNWYVDSLINEITLAGGQGQDTTLRLKSLNQIYPPGLYPVPMTVTNEADSTYSTSITKTYVPSNIPNVAKSQYFTLVADQDHQGVARGSEADYTLTLTSQNSFSGNAQLSIINCPSTATCSLDNTQFSLSSSGTTQTTTFRVKTTSNTIPNSYDIAVIGSSGNNLQVPLFLSLDVNLFPPACSISTQSPITQGSSSKITVSYQNLASQPNSISVKCGNSQTATASNCNGLSGSCSASCSYSSSGTFTVSASIGSLQCQSGSVIVGSTGTSTSTTTTSGASCNYNVCTTCTQYGGCGWATNNNPRCLAGNINGATDGSASGSNWIWYPSQCSTTTTSTSSSTTTSSTTTSGQLCSYNACTDCTPHGGCGWATNNNPRCLTGNINGPTDNSADSSHWIWYPSQCTSTSTSTSSTTSTSTSSCNYNACSTCTPHGGCGWCGTSASSGSCISGSGTTAPATCQSPNQWSWYPSQCGTTTTSTTTSTSTTSSTTTTSSSTTTTTCTPYTCSSLGLNCGTWNNGCGGTINCGTCGANQICDGGQCRIQ